MLPHAGGPREPRITPQFSRGALTHVPWHFMFDRRLQLLYRCSVLLSVVLHHSW
jgi:hypothetical protein